MESDAEKTVLVHFGELARPVTSREDKLFPAAVRERFKEIPAISAPGRKLTFQVKCLASPPPPPPPGGVLIDYHCVGMHVIMVQCPDLWVSRCLPAVRLCGLEIWRLRRSPPLRC